MNKPIRLSNNKHLKILHQCAAEHIGFSMKSSFWTLWCYSYIWFISTFNQDHETGTKYITKTKYGSYRRSPLFHVLVSGQKYHLIRCGIGLGCKLGHMLESKFFLGVIYISRIRSQNTNNQWKINLNHGASFSWYLISTNVLLHLSSYRHVVPTTGLWG